MIVLHYSFLKANFEGQRLYRDERMPTVCVQKGPMVFIWLWNTCLSATSELALLLKNVRVQVCLCYTPVSLFFHGKLYIHTHTHNIFHDFKYFKLLVTIKISASCIEKM